MRLTYTLSVKMKNQILLFSIFIILFSCNKKQQINKTEQISTEINQVENKKKESDSLSLKGIKEIPKEVFSKTWLTYLSVYGQDCDITGIECFAIRKIPKEIENLKNLEVLDLFLNYVDKLPKEILELKKLKILSLSENPNFSDIETVSKIKWLEQFSCFGCYLSKEEIEYLKKQLPNCEISANSY